MDDKKQKKPVKFKISKETIIIILVLLFIFFAWNAALPYIFKIEKVTNVSLPQVKRGNVEFIDEQIQIRKVPVPSLEPQPTDLGRQNPFD